MLKFPKPALCLCFEGKENLRNKSGGLWQTVLERIQPPFSICHLWQESHAALQNYIAVCLIISFQVHTIKYCILFFLLLGWGQNEKCPPKYSLSCLWHAHLSARQQSNFLTSLVVMKEREGTCAVDAVVTHFNFIMLIQSLRLYLNLSYSQLKLQ